MKRIVHQNPSQLGFLPSLVEQSGPWRSPGRALIKGLADRCPLIPLTAAEKRTSHGVAERPETVIERFLAQLARII